MKELADMTPAELITTHHHERARLYGDWQAGLLPLITHRNGWFDVNGICYRGWHVIKLIENLRRREPKEAKASFSKAHRQTHVDRHKMLDSLVAAFLTDNPDKMPSTTTVMELMEWSCEQTKGERK